MKFLSKTTLLLAALALTAIACESESHCPEGMHSQELSDGSTICVPDNQ